MKYFSILILSLVLSLSLFSQTPKFIKAQFFYSKFYTPTDGPYVETYLSVFGHSVEYVKLDNGKFQGRVGVSLVFFSDSTVVNYDKYELLSPEIEDTSNVTFNFLDQQRFVLPNGEYNLEIKINDMNSDFMPDVNTQTIDVNFPDDKISVSGIQLVDSYQETKEANVLSKSGYDLVPYITPYLPNQVNTLTFYAEVYNTDKVLGNDEKFLINYYLQSYETGKKLNKFTSFKRESANAVNIIFANFNVTELPSGNYKLIVEARNRNNEVIASNGLFFQRNNPDVPLNYSDYVGVSAENSFVDKIDSRDTLRLYIDYLGAISSNIELDYVKYQIDKGDADMESMQRFFFNFWLDRDEINPEYTWKQYLSTVDLVNEQFGAPGDKGKKGYQTDMGRVFLKYGPPNTITDRPYDASSSGMAITDGGGSNTDAGMVPYQIWHYYVIEELNLRNSKFVFANVHLALFDYQLIHSNVPGEINNANWQSELHWRFQNGVSMPDRDKYGGQSGDYYNNPR